MYWIFAPVSRFPVATRVMLKLRTNSKTLPDHHLSNKDILNSYNPDILDIGFLRNLIYTKYLSDLQLYVSLIMRLSGGSTYAWVIPKFYPLLWEKFFIVTFLLRSSSSGRLLCKFSCALCFSSIVVMDGLIIIQVNVIVI